MLKNLPRISRNSMDVPMINGIHYVGNDEELIDHSDDTVAGTLANVLVGVGSTESTVEIPPGNYDLQGNTVVVPENVNLKVNRGAMFSNGTLTINGAFEAGLYQVFDDDLNISVFNEAYPEWWGINGINDEIAINKCINVSKIIILSAKRYNTSNTIEINISAKQLVGKGTDITRIYYSGTGIAISSNSDSLGSIVYKNFSLVNTSINGNTKGFYLNHFTRGCRLRNIKIVNFDYGVDIISSWYSSIIDCVFESNIVAFQYGNEMNDFEIFNCVFASNSIHIQPVLDITGISYCFIIRDCSFDAMGTIGSIVLKNIFKGVINSNYFETYPTDPGLSNATIRLDINCQAISIIDNIFIGPSDASYTGTWIDLTAASSVAHRIVSNKQYRSSNSTFLSTVDGVRNVRFSENHIDCPLSIITNDSLITTQIPIRFPMSISNDEPMINTFNTPKSTSYTVYYAPDEDVNLIGKYLRVYREDTGLNILNYIFVEAITANTIINCGVINALVPNINLLVTINKQGGELITPNATIIFEYY